MRSCELFSPGACTAVVPWVEEMVFGWRIMLLLLLLLAAGAQAQSGDGDDDMDPKISCISHITIELNSLNCQLHNRNFDEDDEDHDSIANMTMCFTDYNHGCITKCVYGSGDSLVLTDKPLVDFNLTVQLKSGSNIMTTLDLKKIVKPRPPHVCNFTLSEESNTADFLVCIPYHNDYLKIENQLFQLRITDTVTGRKMLQNISLTNELQISMDHLKRDTLYEVDVRAIPAKFLEGSWSEWGEKVTFLTPPVEEDHRELLYNMVLCAVPVVVATLIIVFFWKKKIFTYMWPNIPHPKDTLVQICKPNKGLLLNFKPEVFSALKVYPMEKAEVRPCEEVESSISRAAANAVLLDGPCSTQSSDCRSTTSVSTEELELSALLSRTSSDGEDGFKSTSPPPINVLQLTDGSHTPSHGHNSAGNEAEVFAVNQQEEAYVTMSSFYQIK